MANIPIEKKSSMVWLWVIIGLLLLALLAWWMLDKDDDVVKYTDNATVATAPVDDTVANPVAIGAATAAAFMVGQTVNLQNATVTSLAGDMAFNIESEGRNALVVFDQVPTPDTAKEGKLDINPGMTVSIDGEVRAASDPMPAGVNAEVPAGTDMYILARDIKTQN